MMKKFIAGLVMGAVLATGMTTFAGGELVKLIVDGNVVVSDAAPQIIDGRVMVPARALAEALGATVLWDEVTASVVVTSPPDPAALVPPGTVDVEGVTYYYIPTLKKLLLDKLGTGRMAMGRTIIIDEKEYESATHGIENTQFYYREVQSLLDADLITQNDLDQYYGK